jgi:capsular exopolysaccharide synthesis family protein
MNEQPAFGAMPPPPLVDWQNAPDRWNARTRSAFDLRYIVAVVRGNLRLSGAIVAVSLAMALVATLIETPRYTAITTIQINDSGDRVIGENDDQTAPRANLSDIDRFLKTQTDILRSRGLAIRVAQKLKLQGNSAFYAAMEASPPRADTAPERAKDEVLDILESNMSATLPHDSRIVTIAFSSADAKLSADIANAYSGEFIQANLQRKFDSSSYAREFVASQLAEAKQRVAQAERSLNAYARSAGLIRAGDAAGQTDAVAGTGGSVTTASLLQVNQAANQATAERVAAEGRWRAVRAVPLLSNQAVLGNGAVTSLLTHRATAQAELEQDLSRHLQDYPSVRDKSARVAQLNSEITEVAQSVRTAIHVEALAAQGTERALLAKLAALKLATLREQDQTVQYGLLKREADTARALYDGLLKRYNELNAAAGISSSNISIVDRADQPTAPTSPNLLRNLLIALIAGLGLATLAVFGKVQLDDTIRVPEDVEAKVQLPLLGVVPMAADGKPESEMADPKSPVSEAFNALRASLLHSTSAGLPQVMLVTSAQSAEGKTTTCFAIAASLARMGRKVVLVDADLRRPSVHDHCGLVNKRGLTSLLTSTSPVESAIQSTTQENLFAVTSGPIPPSPTELISSPRIEEVVLDLARDFDVVIIDSPPVLGLADAPALATLADGVIFVIEADRSRMGSLKGALRRLRLVQPILLGAVLTKFNPARARNRYSEYYGDEYRTYARNEREAA